jgi:DeoR family transcriptional regulator, fructose operon transcriptional repressor
MSFQSRKAQILKIINGKGEVSVKELADLTAISEVTIRRDLIQLSNENLLVRTHGGAMPLSQINIPQGFDQKSAVSLEQKDFIAQLAAQEIQDGDIIFMDCGSTVHRLCQFIKHKQIKVITNSLPVVYELAGSAVSINLIGGELDVFRQAVHGSMALEHIKKYRADKAFLGVDGISVQGGLTAKSEVEAEITQAMLQQAKLHFILCDANKINQNKYLQIADIQTVDVLITNSKEDDLKEFERIGIRVLN